MKGVLQYVCSARPWLEVEWTRVVDSGYMVTLYSMRRTALPIGDLT
jgi:hypothetical protein